MYLERVLGTLGLWAGGVPCLFWISCSLQKYYPIPCSVLMGAQGAVYTHTHTHTAFLFLTFFTCMHTVSSGFIPEACHSDIQVLQMSRQWMDR